MEWNLQSVLYKDRPTVWVITCYENDRVHRRVSLSLDSLHGFLWKRKWMWLDTWFDMECESTPEELWSLEDAVSLDGLRETVMQSCFDGEAHLGTWGPIIQGRDTGLTVRLHLSFNKVFP